MLIMEFDYCDPPEIVKIIYGRCSICSKTGPVVTVGFGEKFNSPCICKDCVEKWHYKLLQEIEFPKEKRREDLKSLSLNDLEKLERMIQNRKRVLKEKLLC